MKRQAEDLKVIDIETVQEMENEDLIGKTIRRLEDFDFSTAIYDEENPNLVHIVYKPR